MRVLLTSPAPPGAPMGNAVTAERWKGHLEALGHEAVIVREWTGQECDLLVALHACKSGPSIARYRKAHPRGPFVVALTGTDLYRDLAGDAPAMARLGQADALIGLHALAARALPETLRSRLRVIFQSVVLPPGQVDPDPESAFACVLSNLRDVKDPLLAAKATRFLPVESRLFVRHAGQPLDAALAAEARREQEDNPRYEFLGPISRDKAFALMAASRLLVLSSLLEGGANVVGEAIAMGLPVLSTDIEGSRGLLGEDHPGFFPVGDARALAALLRRTETDSDYLAELRERSLARQALLDPTRERESLRQLLAEITIR